MQISTLMNDLNDSRTKLLAVLAEHRDATAAGDAWTPAQVIEHIALAEEMIATLLRALFDRARGRGRLTAGAPTEVAIETRYETLVPVYNAIPAFPGSEPDASVTLPNALDRLERARTSLLQVLEESATFDCEALLVPHPVFGRMRFYEWVYLVAAHDRTHTEQLRAM